MASRQAPPAPAQAPPVEPLVVRITYIPVYTSARPSKMSSPPAVGAPEGPISPPPVAPPPVASPPITSPTNPKGQADTFENMATLPVGRAHQPPSGVNVPTPTVPPSAPRGGAANPVRTGFADDVEKNNSSNKEVEALKGRQPINSAAAGAAAAREEKRTSLFIILSFVYAKLLVVICIAYVVSEVITAHIPLVYYEAFFTYLYGASILFLLYVFCFLLQESACCSGETGAGAAERERRKIAAADQKKREKEQAKAAKDKERADKERARKEKKDKEAQEAKQAKEAKEAKAKAAKDAKDAKDAKAKGGKDQKGGKDPKAPKDAEAQPPPPPPQPAQGQQAQQPPSKHATFYQKQEGYPRKMRDLVRSKQQEQHRQGPETDRELEQPLLLASHDAVEMEGGAGTVAIPERSLGRKRKTTQNNSSHGSFFLRVGAIAFGLGTMIYNGLEFGTFFETPFNSPCYQILRGVNPILQMIFTFMQMYFIFMNSRLNIHRFKVIARFGLMHVVATNLCVWIRTLVLESLKEIMAYLALSEQSKAALVTTNATPLFFGGGSNLAENFRLATLKNKHAEVSTTAGPSAVRMVQTTARTLASTAATTLRTTATTLTTLAATTATTPTIAPTTSTTTALPTIFTTPTTVQATFPTLPTTLSPFSMLASSTVTSKVQPSGFSWHGPGSGAETAEEPLPMMEALVSMKFNMTGQRMLNSDTCDRINIMGNIVQESAPYLFPFVIEYCLIGAAVVYIMWKHIGRNPRYVAEEDLEQRLETILSQRAVALARAQQGRVDCVGASKGLFFGLLLLVCSIICLILFFVLVRHPKLGILAIYLADVSHSALMALSIFAIIIGFISNYCCDDDGKSVYSCQLQEQDQPQDQNQDEPDTNNDDDQIVQGLKFKRDEQSDLNDILLRVSAFGLFIYAVFSIIAGSLLATTKEPNLLILVTGALSVLQVILQLLFIADVSRRRVYLPEHDRSKPGRQVVTFLLICNIAMWIIYTFEMQKVAANPVQLDFYGFLPWAIVQRLTLPLCVFHRFHSAVTLAEIWKTSYKARVE